MTKKRPEVVVKVKRDVIQPIKMDFKPFLKNAIILIAILIVVYAFTSAKKIPYEEGELSKVKGESYIVEIPVIEKEYYQEKVHFGKVICPNEYYNYSQTLEIENRILEDEDSGEKKWHLACILSITNDEEKSGEFKFMTTFTKRSGKIDAGPITKNIKGRETEIFEWVMMMDNFGDFVSCTPKRIEIPEMPKCRALDPTQFIYENRIRNITVYKNETRYKGDTKVVQKGYKFVNRIFGYDQFFYLGY